MTTCQSCGTEMSALDRFCRNCGIRMSVLVEDLADTNKFDSTFQPLPIAVAASAQPGDRFQVAASTTAHLKPGSGFLSHTLSVIRSLLNRKLVWLALFLLIAVLVPSGLVIGRDAIRSRRLQRMEYIRDAAIAKKQRQAKQAEATRRSVEEQIQNALGFKPAAVSAAEYPDLQGVFVASLTSDFSPAAVAKIQPGDVLIEFGGQAIPGSVDLAHSLDSLKPGTEVGLKLYRDGATVPSSIIIAARTTPPILPKTETRDQGFLGLGDVARRCCVPGGKQWGLEVHRVVDNSPADLAGFQLGDLITEFDGQSILTADEFARRIHNAKPRSKVKVKFYRGSVAQVVELTLGHGW